MTRLNEIMGESKCFLAKLLLLIMLFCFTTMTMLALSFYFKWTNCEKSSVSLMKENIIYLMTLNDSLKTIEYLQSKLAASIKSKDYLQKLLVRKRTKLVCVTCYNSTIRQTDKTPFITAINHKVGPGQVAVSRDLLKDGFTFKRKVWLEGLGVFKITDTMNERIENTIDVWVPKGTKNFKHEKILAVIFD